MNKLLLLLSALFVLSPSTFGQNKQKTLDQSKLECIYRLSTKESADAKANDFYTILMSGENLGVFKDYSLYQQDSVSLIDGVSNEVLKAYKKKVNYNPYYFDPVIYQSPLDGSLEVYDIIVPNAYMYSEEVPTAWELSDDTLTVAGYLCQKAVLQYGSKTWTAWYAMDIPMPYGPWKLCGLPGLILKAETEDSLLSFDAIVIRSVEAPILEFPKRLCIKGKRNEIVALKNERYKDPMNNLPTEGINDIQIMKSDDGSSLISINGYVLRKDTKYIPLEE